MMHFTETQQGDMLTISVHVGLPDATYTATLSGRMRGPILDALLWWALGRTMDHLVATAQPIVWAAQFHQANSEALYTGESLVHFTTVVAPFYEADDERAQRIMRVVHEHLPELAPLATMRPGLQPVYELAQHIAAILVRRVGDPTATVLHGVEEVYNKQDGMKGQPAPCPAGIRQGVLI